MATKIIANENGDYYLPDSIVGQHDRGEVEFFTIGGVKMDPVYSGSAINGKNARLEKVKEK